MAVLAPDSSPGPRHRTRWPAAPRPVPVARSQGRQTRGQRPRQRLGRPGTRCVPDGRRSNGERGFGSSRNGGQGVDRRPARDDLGMEMERTALEGRGPAAGGDRDVYIGAPLRRTPGPRGGFSGVAEGGRGARQLSRSCRGEIGLHPRPTRPRADRAIPLAGCTAHFDAGLRLSTALQSYPAEPFAGCRPHWQPSASVR